MRNGSFQGAYLVIAARPWSGLRAHVRLRQWGSRPRVLRGHAHSIQFHLLPRPGEARVSVACAPELHEQAREAHNLGERQPLRGPRTARSSPACSVQCGTRGRTGTARPAPHCAPETGSGRRSRCPTSVA